MKTLSVPVTYASLKNKDIDVFLGNWMPSMTADIQAYLDDKSIEQLAAQLDQQTIAASSSPDEDKPRKRLFSFLGSGGK